MRTEEGETDGPRGYVKGSYPARIRTWTKRTKISCATVTLPGKE
jgi:hypothetical protein